MHHLHEFFCWTALCEWQGGLHMGDCYNLTNVRVFIQHSVNNHPTLTFQISSTVMVGVQYFPLLPLGVKKDGHVAVTLQ